MPRRLTDYVARLTPEEATALPLQDIAIAALCYEGHRHESARMAEWASIPEAIEAWLARTERPKPETEGMRTQWFLRDMVEGLASGSIDTVQWDEAAFLFKVYEFACAAADPAIGHRIIPLLRPAMLALKGRLDSLEPAPALPTIGARIRFLTSKDIAKSPPRTIQHFAGIHLPFTEPVLRYRGHVKVLDYVPEKTAVVSEAGSCCVQGFLLGRVAAAKHIEVHENIGGMAMVREGDIRSRKIIDNAHVISKQGSIYCRQALNPKQVFAGNTIRIGGDAVLGEYIAPTINIQGSAQGCVLHSCGTITAGRIAQRLDNQSHIVLRRKLSSADYGEKLPADVARDVLMARGLQRRVASLQAFVERLYTEIDDHAGNILYYLYCSDSHQARLLTIQAAQRRQNVLRRLTEAMSALAYLAEEYLDALYYTGQVEPERLNRLSGGYFKTVRRELTFCLDLPAIDDDLRTAIESALELAQHIENNGGDNQRIASALFQARKQRLEYDALMAELQVQIQREQAELERAADNILTEKAANQPRAKLVTQLIEALQDRHAKGLLATRIRSEFVLRSIDLMEGLRLRLQETEEATHTTRYELQTTLKRIGSNEPALMALREATQENPAQISSAFVSGARIYADPIFLAQTNPPSAAFHLPAVSDDTVQTFVRTPDGSIVARD